MELIIEKYDDIYVAREDCFSIGEGSPPFSKMRGVYKRLEKLKSSGVETVGYVESNISMAGYGVAYICKKLDMKCIIFNPVYKHADYPGADVHKTHFEKWKQYGAEIISFPAGMVKVNFFKARKYLRENYKNFVLLPLGLPFYETINETCRVLTSMDLNYKSIVVAVGSGTICAGLLRGIKPAATLYGIMTRTGSVEEKTQIIRNKSHAVFYDTEQQIEVIDVGWKYSEKSEAPSPFPTHDYYDRKAWQWLLENKNKIEHPILFWNIGRNV